MSATVMQWSLTQQCGPSRGFCPECDNSFTIKSAGPYRCGTPNICMTRGSGCDVLHAPAGYVVEVYMNGSPTVTHGPYFSSESAIAYGSEPECDFPGTPNLDQNVGCGYRIDTEIGGPQVDFSYSPPSFVFGFIPKAILVWYFPGLVFGNPSPQITDWYGADVDLTLPDGYMQVLTFRWVCGQSQDSTTVIKAYPFRN